MIIHPDIKIYGDLSYRNSKCPKESIEQITFISRIRNKYPDTHGITIFHVKNEAKLINGQFQGINKDRAMGMSKGCVDIHNHGNPSLCMELKRQDHTLSTISEEQIKYILAAQNAGSFACIALGCDAAENAFQDWLKMQKRNPHQF